MTFPPTSSIFLIADLLNDDAVILYAFLISPFAKIFTGRKFEEIKPFLNNTSESIFLTLILVIVSVAIVIGIN